MNKIGIKIWSRDFELPIIIETFDEDATEIQNDTVKKLEEYADIIEASLKHVEEYILANGLRENGIDEVDNIFKYVMPKTFFIPKSENRVVGLLCNYKFDMEHGLAVVFENEKFKEIGSQDIIL